MVPPVFAGGCALAAPVAAGGAALGFGDLWSELLHADAVSANATAASRPGLRSRRADGAGTGGLGGRDGWDGRAGMGDRGNVHTSGAGSDVPDKEEPQ